MMEMTVPVPGQDLVQDAPVFGAIGQEGPGGPNGIVVLQIVLIESLPIEITGDDLILQDFLDFLLIGVQGAYFSTVDRQEEFLVPFLYLGSQEGIVPIDGIFQKRFGLGLEAEVVFLDKVLEGLVIP